MNRKGNLDPAIRVGIIISLLLCFCAVVLPGTLLAPALRNHYYGGLCVGGAMVLITAFLAREW